MISTPLKIARVCIGLAFSFKLATREAPGSGLQMIFLGISILFGIALIRILQQNHTL